MKRLFLTLLCLLIFCGIADARMLQGVAGSAATSGSSYCDIKSGYLICEDFEDTSDSRYCYGSSGDRNCRNEWTLAASCGGTYDFSYTTSPLEGTNSLYINESESGDVCGFAIDSTTRSASYAYFKFVPGVIDLASGNSVSIYNQTARCDMIVGNNNDNVVFGIKTGNGTTYSSISAVQGTTYEAWLEFAQDTTNGCKLYISSSGDGVKPAVSVQGDTIDFPRTYVQWIAKNWSNNTVNQIKLDTLLIDDSPIGNQ